MPVEFEIDKKLGIQGKEDVEKMGIRAYNGSAVELLLATAKNGRSWSIDLGAGSIWKTTIKPWSHGTWKVYGQCSKRCGTRT